MLSPIVAAELDGDALQRLRELDPTGANRLLARIFEAFATSTARLIPQMHAALEAGDRDGVRHVVHTLKSSSASVGALRLATICGEIEALVRSDLGDAPQSDASQPEASHIDAPPPLASLAARIEQMDGEIAAVLRALEQLSEPTA